MWVMQLSRARRLSSERTTCHGACLLSVLLSIMSRAREKAYQRRKDSRSIGLNFHCRTGSSMRARNRRSCSSWPTSSQILIRMMPPSTTYFSTCGQSSRKRRCCSSLQNPMTYSTPARLYQLRSKITISPPAGNCSIYRCMNIWDFCRSDGAGSATTRKTRGLTRSVRALMVPPLPAASRPSNTMMIRAPLALTHSCKWQSSTCSLRNSFS